MLVKIRLNCLIFEGLDLGQKMFIEKWAGNVVIFETENGWKVEGKKDELFALLYELSKAYDIELV